MSSDCPLLLLPRIVSASAVLCATLICQNAPTSAGDAFFLDLGIVIEPSTGNEEVRRLIKAPPEGTNFLVDKAPSGSVFMASTKELQETLERISLKIENLEVALRKEVATLQGENNELREMIADLLEREPVIPPQFLVPVIPQAGSEPLGPAEDHSNLDKAAVTGSAMLGSAIPVDSGAEAEVEAIPEENAETEAESDPLVLMPKAANLKTTADTAQPPAEQTKNPPAFNKMLYMNAVFAYQREDYKAALRHFAKLHMDNVDEITAGNVSYWMADCYYQLGEYADALKTLEQIKPLMQSDKQDDAMVLTGLVYRQMGNEVLAVKAFNSVVRYYPDSEYYRLAKMEVGRSEK